MRAILDFCGLTMSIEMNTTPPRFLHRAFYPNGDLLTLQFIAVSHTDTHVLYLWDGVIPLPKSYNPWMYEEADDDSA